MGILRRLIDNTRTLVGIRKVRTPPVAGEKPSLGTSIVRDDLRIRVRHPIDDTLWTWLTDRGWRAMETRNNRRQYRLVSDKVLVKLIKADPRERESIESTLASAPARK